MLPVELLLAVVQWVLQLWVRLTAVLQPLLQAAVFLPQSVTLLPALLQFGGPPGQSLPKLLVLLLLVWIKTGKFSTMNDGCVANIKGFKMLDCILKKYFTSRSHAELFLQGLVLSPKESYLVNQLALLFIAANKDVGGCWTQHIHMVVLSTHRTVWDKTPNRTVLW